MDLLAHKLYRSDAELVQIAVRQYLCQRIAGDPAAEDMQSLLDQIELYLEDVRLEQVGYA